MKLINQVKKHGKAVTLHLKRHHKKYIFGILSVSLFVKGISLIVAHTLVHNLSFANILTGDDTDSIINAEFDDNELTENLDGLTDGSDTKINSENIEGGNLEKPENSTDPEEPIVDENPEKPEILTNPEEPIVDDDSEEPVVSEDTEEPENSTDPEEPVVDENSEDPENSTDPEELVVSEDPEEPENSTYLEEPVVSEDTEEPENSTDPEGPVVSEDPEEPENSTDPEESTDIEGVDEFVATRGLGDSENIPEELEGDDEYFDEENEEDYIEDEFFDGEWDDDFDEEFLDDEEASEEFYEYNRGKGIDGNTETRTGELTTFEKAFQEVAYAYYMRGPYMHYNFSKGVNDILSPEESTSQDYHYMTCTPFVMNVYKELLGIVLTPHDSHYGAYARDYVGKRPEVIGYGRKSGDNLYWSYGTGITIPEECDEAGINPTSGCIIKQLKIGDILLYAGHAMLVYDYVFDENGNIVDVYLIHSRQSNYRTKTKADHGTENYYNISGNKVNLKFGHSQWSRLGYNYHNRTGLYTGLSRVEGTVILEKLTEHKYLKFPWTGKSYYTILRLVDDTDGNSYLNFNGQWSGGKKFIFYDFLGLGSGPSLLYNDNNTLKNFIGLEVGYSDSVQSRLKYSKLYIEKTVDKKDNNIVEPDDELIYTIKIQNNSKKAYTGDLIVTEYIDTNLVEYKRTSRSGAEINGNQLQWNIGKLNSGDEIVIEYTVKVKTGHLGSTIESIGSVDNIPSGTIKNKIGKNLKEQDSSLIASEYNELKGDYTGRTLINEIYRNVYGVDLGLDNLIITGSTKGSSNGLILYNSYGDAGYSSTYHAEMKINKNNIFSGMVLNSYFNVLRQSGFVAIDRNITLYEVPPLWPYKNPDNRANTIYPTDFKTGDILIYKNINDVKYSGYVDSGGNTGTKITPITYENGEYAYIYIDGKFVGINPGKDGEVDEGGKTGDDRNEFTTGYYAKAFTGYTHYWYKTATMFNTDVITPVSQIDIPGGFENWLQYQTLFGKDYYVVLRPSLMIRNISYELNGGTGNDENPSAFILGSDIELKEPTKTGYVFSGWYTDSEYTNQVTNTRELTDDVVLYAKWMSNCTFQGINIIHGNSLTVYSAGSTTCPATCITGTVTCNNGTVLGNTEYSNLNCSPLPVSCDASFTLTSTGSHGIYESCIPFTVSNNSCTPGITVYKLSNCANGYHTENGSGCTSNTKMVSCTQSGKPENSSYVTGNVQVTWNGERNNGGWSTADNCGWTCDSGYTQVGNVCRPELTTREKAFQEVAYAYYMRGPYLQYNLAKGIGSIVSPEQSTNQDYHHMACTTYVMNVYNELLGINLSANGAHYSRYAKKYVGVRPEVIGYGLLQTGGDDKGSLYWYDGTTQYSSTGYNRKDPTQSYIISQLRIGDIIQYGGHSMLVYDYKYDSSGKIEDVYLLNSLQTNYYMSKMKAGHLEGSYYYKSGVAKSLEIFPAPWSNLYFTYRDRSGWYEGMGRIEGTIRLEKFTGRAGFSFPGFATGDYREYYAILRFVTTDSSGNSVLNFSGGYTYFKSATQTGVANNQIIEYSDSVKSRLKYSKLYIEKTVDKKDNNVVEPGDELTYTIRIQNNSDQAYDDDLIIKENINTDLVENLRLYSYEKNGTQIQEIQLLNDGNQLQWNIGKLNSGDEVIIEYTVKVKTGYIGETIESTGLVDHIPSGTIKNKIGRKLNEHNSSGIVSEYDILKAQYTGKLLINEIYKKVYGVDLGLDDFIITGNINGESSGLILYNQKSGTWYYGGTTHAKMYINPVNLFSGMVLNNYFNTLYVSTGRISDNNVNITLYAIPAIWKEENNPDNKANIIYPTDFKTGDVLIYTNINDVKYSVSGHDTVKNYMTYEDGEYAYIYMDGKFVGVNLGNDLEYTGDDRNEFTRQYYDDNNLSWYSKSSTPLEDTEELKEFLQYQTLFGKDAYVILRPSLVIRNITYDLSGGTNNDENPSVFILGRDVELKEPAKTGFTFQGWYIDQEYTNQVNSTSELTDDVVLYAKWENNTHELTTFQKAFQEVAYAYYMRGPYIHYNSARGRGHDFSPEEATSQDYNYLACGLYVLNVYRELLGNFITFPYHGGQNAYAKKYVGKRPEVIGYGEKTGGDLYWWDETTQYLPQAPKVINPTKNDIINQLQIGDIFGYDGHVTMVYDYKYNENGDKEDVYLIHATDSPQYRVYSKMNLGATVYDNSGNSYDLSIGHNKWSAIRYNIFDRTAQSGHHPDARVEGTVQLNIMSNMSSVLKFNTGNYSSHYYILRFVTDDGSGNSILSINGTGLTGYRECSTCSYTNYSGQINYSDSVQSRLKYNKLYIEKTVNRWDDSVVGADDELTYTIKIQNNSDKIYDENLIVKEIIDTNLVENLGLYSYKKNGIQTQEIQLSNNEDELQWNIGKLNRGDEVIIEYTVKVRPGNIGETIESTGMVGDIPSGIITNTIGRNTDKGANLKAAYNNLNNNFTGKFLINEIYKEVYGIDLELDKIVEINTGNELDTGALIYYNNKWGSRNNNWDNVEMQINKKSPYSGMVLNGYFNVLYKNINDAHAVNKSGDEITITRYGFPAIAVKANDVDKRADTIFPGNFQTGDILIYKNSNDLYYNWKTSSGYTYSGYAVSHTNTYENGEYAYIYMDGKFVGMNLGNDLTGIKDNRNEFTTNYYSNVGINSRYYTDSGVGIPQNIPGGFNNWLHYQSLFGKEAYVILRPSLMIRDITYELNGGTNDDENPSAFILGRDAELKEPTKTGYVFSGWYTDSEYTTQVTNTNELTDDVVLYAKWENSIHELTTFEKAFQEVAYAYYMRGPRIQYNSKKAEYAFFSPEESTIQNYNHLVCAAFSKNVYYDLLGITIPEYNDRLIHYTTGHLGSPEVVGYGVKTGNDFIMRIYDFGNAEAESGYIQLTGDGITLLNKIIPFLRIGDVLTYDGHVVMVYDLYDSETGKNAILMQSAHGAGLGYIRTKISGKTTIGNISFGSANHYLFHNSKDNTDFTYGLKEGSLNLLYLTDETYWKKIGTSGGKTNYSILRFVQENESGEEVIKYNSGNYNDTLFLSYLSEKTKDRLKFSKLFIEKTVSEHADDVVEPGTTMSYTIVAKNNSNEDYTDDLIITENLSEFVTYDGYTSNKEGVEFNKNDSILTWNIGKLNAGEEIIIEYSVDVNNGDIGDVIISTGSVGNIPSATIKNKIGKSLNEERETSIKASFENLKSDYNGKELIDNVYKKSLGVDLNLTEFDITELITNENPNIGSYKNVYLNTGNSFSGMILNKYWNTLWTKEYNYSDTLIYSYNLNYWRPFSHTSRRADTIYSENFRTGDILIYTNKNDYTYSGGDLTMKQVTYEDGEYAYIYIDGKFIGVNLGNDGQSETLDDRNEFTRQYYIGNNLYWYTGSTISGTNEFKDWLHYQTLFGKDYYVVLRPSLMIRNITYELSGGTNNAENPSAFILGSDIELKEPTKSGFTFEGWYTDSEYTNQVTNTRYLTDDVVLYAKWENNTHELTTFEKAFQEVAYAYYMRGPYLHYNVTKGYGDVNAESPEEATSQDYNYLACGLFVMNVYKELLNIKFYQSTRQYAATYFGQRPEVIGYGIKTGGNLNWYDKDHNKQNPLVNPTTGDIIPLLQIGDIIHHYGHEMLVYDLIYDDSGNVVDVYLIHANAGGGYRTRSKNHGDDEIYNISGNKVSIGIGHAPWANLYYNNIDNRGLYPGSRIEGTIKLQKFSEKGGNALLLDGNINHYVSDYAILRFVTNSGGKDVLSFDGTYRAYTGEKIDNEEIGMDYYSDRVKSRLKYSKLYIEKTVDKRDNDIVEQNEELTYTIKIQNNSDNTYDDELIVKENVDTNLVQNLGRYSYKINGTETNGIQLSNNGNRLQWNIGKLNSGDEVIIEYTVKVKTGHIGETIESTGMVDNIPSGTLKNKIGKNTTKGEELKQSYNNLSGSYTGKTLINQIYEETYGINLGLDNLNILTNTSGDVNGVIYFNNKWGTGSNWRDYTYLYINKKNLFSGMVLNSYFNALYKRSIIRSYNVSGNEIKVQIYALPSLSTRESDPDVRANTIYPTDFQTGDILIYMNENDIYYSVGENITVTGEDGNVLYSGPSTKETYRTYEDGEYAYIYIDGKFVGVNLGNDLTGTKDDRNEFTLSYYTDNSLSLYATSKYSTSLKTGFGTTSMPDGGVDWLQYQTLFGKDAYVVLRPSLMIRNITYDLSGGTNNDENPNSFILGRDIELKEPTKTGYVFSGWYTGLEYTNQVTNTNELTDDAILYAKWENTYTVTWKNRDGTVLETDEDVEYGSSPEYNGSIPTKTGDAQYSYTFAGWSPATGVVQGDQTYTAQYTTSINEYLITFKNYDGSILETSMIPYGDTPYYQGETPKKEPDQQYYYVFSEWTPEIVPVIGTATYTAQFNTVGTNEYTITLIVSPTGYGAFSQYSVTAIYGSNIIFDGNTLIVSGTTVTATPRSNPKYTYNFSGRINSCGDTLTHNCTITGDFTRSTNTYTVTWKNRDGTVLETDENVEYGSSPEYNGVTPTKTGDAQYNYTFAGWSPTTGVVQGDVTYTAQYTTSINEYLITFKNYDGSILETGIVVYGETPTYNGNTPSKEGGYEFSGWNPTIHPVNGIQVYTAMFRDIQGPTGEIIVSYLSGYLTNGCTSGNITLTLTGSDINGLATEPYKRDEGLWTTNNEKTFTNNAHGTGYIKDVAGNVTPIPYNITGISKTGLVISLDSPENGSILTGFVKLERAVSIINPTCQALSGGYNIIVYSGTEEIYTGNTVGTSIDGTFQDGTYTWKVYANDILGHTSTSDIWTFIINSQAPTCDIDYTPAKNLGWISGDVQSILTGCSQGTTGFNATGYLFTGNGTYEFTFRNEFGITGNKIAHVRRIDKVPPYLQEVTPIGTATDTTPNYTFSSTESGNIAYSGACSSTTTQAISGNNTITLNALAVGTYSGCAITVTDKAGNISNVLNISEFTIRSSGGGGSTLKRDKCPGGDFSDSYYDGICENNRKNTHNAPNTDIGSSYQIGDEFIYDKQIFDSKYSDEMNQAYQFAYYYGITTKNSISAADMNGGLTRIAMAKMLSQYAINVLGKEPDNTRQNTFVDVSSKLDSDYSSGVTLAYQLGIMGINMKDNKFRPYDTVSRAEFVTALSRLLYGIEDGKDKYYSTHMNLLKYKGILTDTNPTMKELRGYVMLMLMRSEKIKNN